MKDEDVCVLHALVKKGTGHASFTLNLEQLGQDQEVRLECLSAYARPWDGEADDSADPEWKLSLDIEYESNSRSPVPLGEFEAGQAPSPQVLVERLKLAFDRLAKSSHLAAKYKPAISFLNTSNTQCVLVLPPGWSLEFKDLDISRVLGFYGITSYTALVEHNEDHGSLVISNKSYEHPCTLTGGQVNGNLKLLGSLTPRVEVGPKDPDVSASYSANPPVLNIGSIQQWLKTALARLLEALHLDVHLLACTVEKGSLQLLANQSMGKLPFMACVSFGDKMAEDLHEQSRKVLLHFDLTRHEAMIRGAEAQHEVGSWHADSAKGPIPWADPLLHISPFYLVSDALEGSSYLSRAGNVSVVACVGRSSRAQISMPIKTRGRAGQLSLKVLDSEMRECYFSQNFKFFIVFRMS